MSAFDPLRTLRLADMLASVRWLPLLLVFAVGGCAGEKNTFEVQDPHGLVRSASLQLCGSETPLVRKGNRLALVRSVSCEGDGEVRLIYEDGEPEHCLIGYVTPDLKQDWHFRAEQSSCRPLL